MKSAILWFGAVATLVIGVILLLPKYDEWFVYPAKRAFVNDNLKDPASTQYRNERMTKAGWLCGELNSKNGNGGYVGFKRFVAGSADDAYLEDYGYFGKEVESGARILERLEIKNTIIRRHLILVNSGAVSTRLSESELEELIIIKIFETKWNQICGTS